MHVRPDYCVRQLEQLPEQSTIYMLGNISGGYDPETMLRLRKLRDQKDFTYRLVSGTLDGCHPAHPEHHALFRPYLGVFETIDTLATIYLRHAGTVLLCHYPYPDGKQGFNAYRPLDCGFPLIHGHIKANRSKAVTRSPRGSLQINVHMFTQGSPVSLERIERVLKEKEGM